MVKYDCQLILSWHLMMMVVMMMFNTNIRIWHEVCFYLEMDLNQMKDEDGGHIGFQGENCEDLQHEQGNELTQWVSKLTDM